MNEIQNRRQFFDGLGQNYPKATSVKVQPALIDGVSCYWFTPENPVDNKIIIHLHGGAFVVGSIQSHESMVSHFSEKLQTKILFVEYSLAPERPYPNAGNDVLKVYKALLSNYPGHEISFMGDSAGAGITVSVIDEIQKQQLPLPHAAIMISPWISLACNNASHEDNRAKDPILSPEYLKASAKLYTGDNPTDVADPEHAEFSQFPPVLIMVGTNEVLLDDSINFYNSIKTKQLKATLSIYENQNHVWPLANINSEASQKALAEVATFLSDLA